MKISKEKNSVQLGYSLSSSANLISYRAQRDEILCFTRNDPLHL